MRPPLLAALLLAACLQAAATPNAQPAAYAAVSAQHRRAITLDAATNQATITDTSTGQARTVMTGLAPVRAAVLERTGHAYIIGKGLGLAPNAGTLTEIELRSGLARTYPVMGMTPEGLAIDEPGGRVFVLGSIVQRNSEWMPLYAQAFDVASRHMSGEPVLAGRLPRHPVEPVKVSAAFDPTSANLYVADSHADRLNIVPTAGGELRGIDLEAPAHALVLNPGTRTMLASFPTLGYAGVFALSGERLDTVALTRAPAPGDLEGMATTVVNHTDVWVDPAKPGSGVFLDQQGATLFATLFTHDASGNPTWLFMSNGVRQADGSFAGDLYRTRGPIDEATRNATAVGSLRFIPGRGEVATLIYYADGMLHSRNVQRLRFGEATRECRWSVSPDKAIGERTNFTALWSNPADPGWGVAVSQLGDVAFAVLFSYDEQNRAAWAVMSRGRRNAQGGFTGDVYRAVQGRIELAGSMTLAFSKADRGTLRYRLSGLDFQAPILRNTFARLATQCLS